MKYYQAAQKRALDIRRQELQEQEDALEVFDAAEHEGEPEEIDTSFGRAVITEGNVLLSSAKQTIIVPKAALENEEQWIPVAAPKKRARK